MTDGIATTQQIESLDQALAKAETRWAFIRGAQKLWVNVRDPRISTLSKVMFGSSALVAWIAYGIFPFDLIPDAALPFLLPFLGPFAFIVLLDDLLLIPLVSGWLFNKWCDHKRK